MAEDTTQKMPAWDVGGNGQRRARDTRMRCGTNGQRGREIPA